MNGPDHQAFLANLVKGQRAEVVVALRLLLLGLTVRLDPRREDLRPTPAGYSRFSDDTDILVEGCYRVEVKSSTYRFTSPEDWPFPWGAYMWAKARWDEAAEHPHAFVLFSEPTGAALAVNGDSHPEWFVTENNDHRRERLSKPILCAPPHLIRPFDELTRYLVRRFVTVPETSAGRTLSGYLR